MRIRPRKKEFRIMIKSMISLQKLRKNQRARGKSRLRIILQPSKKRSKRKKLRELGKKLNHRKTL